MRGRRVYRCCVGHACGGFDFSDVCLTLQFWYAPQFGHLKKVCEGFVFRRRLFDVKSCCSPELFDDESVLDPVGALHWEPPLLFAQARAMRLWYKEAAVQRFVRRLCLLVREVRGCIVVARRVHQLLEILQFDHGCHALTEPRLHPVWELFAHHRVDPLFHHGDVEFVHRVFGGAEFIRNRLEFG